MPGESNFRSEDERRQGDNAVLESSFDRRPARLELTSVERRAIPAEALGLLSPMMNRAPSTWTWEEVQAVEAALERADGNDEAAAVLSRLRHMSPAVRDHQRDYREVVTDLRQVNDDLASMRRRPNTVTQTFARRLAEVRVDGMKLRAGREAAEAEREACRTNPGDPQVRAAVQAARDKAAREVELQRPRLEDEKSAEVESRRVKQLNDTYRKLSSRKSGLVKILREANVPVPPEPRELVS